MRKLILLGVLTTILLGASATGASATTFSGSCQFEGTIRIVDSPLTLRPDYHDFEALGVGTCEGSLNGAPYDGPARQYMDGRMNAPFSCAGGTSHDVPGTLTFGEDPGALDATQIDVFVSESHVGRTAPAYVRGAYNGHGWSVINLQGDQETLEKCAGAGVSETKYDLEVHTITPLYG